MKKATALLIKNRYPENIRIIGIENPPTGKWKVEIFLLKEKRIDSLLLESPFAFETRFKAEQHGRELCKSIINDSGL